LLCREAGDDLECDETLLKQEKIKSLLPNWQKQASKLYEELNDN
jgi:hypothetical protein